jgi:pimeloyl-ACP methyl ester carboxylesterase
MSTDLPAPYRVDKVQAPDGTTIGFRSLGHGPGIVIIHGAMQASQNFMKLAFALSNNFTLHILDRRGRGLSGPVAKEHNITSECADVRVVVEKTGSNFLFGHSSGAIIALKEALLMPTIQKVALYEPPFSVVKPAQMDWVVRLEREITNGELNHAVVTVIKGVEASKLLTIMPRFILSRLIAIGIKKGDHVTGDDVPFRSLIPTTLVDMRLVKETAGEIQSFSQVSAKTLLMGGSKSSGYLKQALNELESVLPHNKRVEFKGLDHSAPDFGDPKRVAEEMRVFFMSNT